MNTNSISKWVNIHMTFHEQEQFMKSSVSFLWRDAVLVWSVGPAAGNTVSGYPEFLAIISTGE
jgi:hypothetical protein